MEERLVCKRLVWRSGRKKRILESSSCGRAALRGRVNAEDDVGFSPVVFRCQTPARLLVLRAGGLRRRFVAYPADRISG